MANGEWLKTWQAGAGLATVLGAVLVGAGHMFFAPSRLSSDVRVLDVRVIATEQAVVKFATDISAMRVLLESEAGNARMTREYQARIERKLDEIDTRLRAVEKGK